MRHIAVVRAELPPDASGDKVGVELQSFHHVELLERDFHQRGYADNGRNLPGVANATVRMIPARS